LYCVRKISERSENGVSAILIKIGAEHLDGQQLTMTTKISAIFAIYWEAWMNMQ
jgi:hypothetical protein